MRSASTGWGAGAAVVEDQAFAVLPRSLSKSIAGITVILLLGFLAAVAVARLQQKRGLAETISAAKDEFIAALSHEIWNPLAAISSATQVLHLSLPRESPHCPSVEMMQRQVGQLRHLLDDLLDTSRAVHGKLSLKLAEVELVSLVKAQIAERGDRSSNIDLELPSEPLIISADAVRVKQMIDNLLDNAEKYGGGQIFVHVMSTDDHALCEVTDNGIGLEPALLKRLFVPFVHAPQSADRSLGGLGLGLALVKRLAELHGGSVTASSEGLNKGSTFVLSLPLATPRTAVAGKYATPVVHS